MDYKDETIPCRICGQPTPMLGVKLCDGCWKVDNNFLYLVLRNREAAKRWLQEQLQKLDATEGSLPEVRDVREVYSTLDPKDVCRVLFAPVSEEE